MDDKQKFDHALIPYLHIFQNDEQSYLRLSRNSSSRDRFFKTKQQKFTFPAVKRLDIEALRQDLESLMTRAKQTDLPTAAQALYQSKFQEQGTAIDLLQATKEENDILFHEKSVELYGLPKHDLFWSAYTKIQDNFKEFISDVGSEYPTLLEIYDLWQSKMSDTSVPDFNLVREIPFYGGYHYPDNPEITSAEKVLVMFQDYLQKNDTEDWTLHIAGPGVRSAFSINQQTKTIQIPHSNDLWLRRKSLKKKSIVGLMEHELGVHVRRREYGERSKLALLGVGLAGYLKGEEGIATFAEELVTGTNDYSHQIGYCTAGIALGLGSHPKNFIETYDIVHLYFILSFARAQYLEDGFCEIEEIMMYASHAAWNRTMRTFRGTTGYTPGAIYTKDLLYLEGNHGIWNIADKVNPIVEPSWLIGKYDPMNKEHVTNLQELGIL